MISYTNFRKDVPTVELAQVVEFLDSKRKPITEKNRITGPYPYYGANGVQDYVADWIFDEDLILLAEDGGHFENPDRGVAYKITGKTWVNNHAHVLRAKKVDVDYLKHVLKNMDLMPYVNGATRLKLTKSSAEKIKIPLPPLAEQKRIAAILDKAAEIKAKREQAIAKLDELAQSTFNSLMNEAKDRSAITLEECVLDMHQGINTVTEEVQYFDEGYPIIQSKHITSGYLDLTDVRYVSSSDFAKYKAKYKPVANNILLCNIGTIGKSILVQNDVDFLVAWNLFLIKADESKVVPIFLKHYFDWLFDNGHFNKFLTGGTVKFISKKTLSSTQIELPSLSMQKDFAAIALAIQHSKEMHQTSLNNICKLITSLQHQAFTTGFNA